MDPQRTLANVQDRLRPQSNDTSRSFNTYLAVYAINLAYRFPDVTNLETINYEVVEGIARFSSVCSNIAIQVWDEAVTRRERDRLKTG